MQAGLLHLRQDMIYGHFIHMTETGSGYAAIVKLRMLTVRYSAVYAFRTGNDGG